MNGEVTLFGIKIPLKELEETLRRLGSRPIRLRVRASFRNAEVEFNIPYPDDLPRIEQIAQPPATIIEVWLEGQHPKEIFASQYIAYRYEYRPSSYLSLDDLCKMVVRTNKVYNEDVYISYKRWLFTKEITPDPRRICSTIHKLWDSGKQFKVYVRPFRITIGYD